MPDVIKPPRRGYADGPYGQIHYRCAGDGLPVLLAHQAPMSAMQFNAAYPLFSGYKLFAVAADLPGFGLSDPPPEPPTINDYARSLIAVLDHLEIERVNPVGHHTGAFVVTELALIAPERVNKLILHGAMPTSADERAEYMNVVARERAYRAESDGSHLTQLWQNRIPWMIDNFDPNVLTRSIVDQLLGLGPFWYGHNAVFNYDHGAALEKLDCPTLLLTNTGDMIHEYVARAREMRPDFSYQEIPGGDADIVDEQPEAWVQAISDFLSA